MSEQERNQPTIKPHEIHTEVRYAETDQMGYAHHATAVVWFELGRVAWLREIGKPYKQLESEGTLMPVIELKLTYFVPARFEDRIAIQTELRELGRSTLLFVNRASRLAADGQKTLLAEGQVRLACVGSNGRIKRIPEDLRALLNSHLVAEVPKNREPRG